MNATEALRASTPLPINPDLIESCLNSAQDAVFEHAWRNGLHSLPPSLRRGRLAGITGHIAESVVELFLAEHGWIPVSHHPGPGRHGIDLLMLAVDADLLFVVEVKGTLRPGHHPRLSRREVEQMSPAWLDKPDNPGLSTWDLRSADAYGAIAILNLADQQLRIALSGDLLNYQPVDESQQLDNPSWIQPNPRPESRARPT